MSTDVDLEELRRRKHQNSSTPAEERRACEDCGSVRIHLRGTGHSGGEYEHDYYCNECQEPCDATGTARSAGGPE